MTSHSILPSTLLVGSVSRQVQSSRWQSCLNEWQSDGTGTVTVLGQLIPVSLCCNFTLDKINLNFSGCSWSSAHYGWTEGHSSYSCCSQLRLGDHYHCSGWIHHCCCPGTGNLPHSPQQEAKVYCTFCENNRIVCLRMKITLSPHTGQFPMRECMMSKHWMRLGPPSPLVL